MFDITLLSGENTFLNKSALIWGLSFPISFTMSIFSFSVVIYDWIAEDIASIERVLPIILGFFATKRASAVPAPIAIEIALPPLRIKNTGKTILLF